MGIFFDRKYSVIQKPAEGVLDFQAPDQAFHQSGCFEIFEPGMRSGNCAAFSIAGRICRMRLSTSRNLGAIGQRPGHTANTGFFRSTDTMRTGVAKSVSFEMTTTTSNNPFQASFKR